MPTTKKLLSVFVVLSILVQMFCITSFANDALKIPNGHILLYGEHITGLNALEKCGFSFDEWITHKTGRPDPTYVPYRNSDDVAYFIYQVPKDGTASYVEFEITVDIYFADKVTADKLLNNLFASPDNKNYVSYTNIQITEGVHSVDETSEYVNYTIKALLPEGTKFIKFDATEFAEMTFMPTNILIYGERIDTFDYSTVPSLYKTYEPYFNMAVAVEPADIYNYNELILTQFNEITIENQAKPHVIHSNRDWYYFEGVDKIVNFAQKHGKRVRFHALVYEKSMPGWFLKNEDGTEASKEVIWQRLEEHVRTIVRRYKGKIYAYDVVNENFGHEGWDTRRLSEILGTDEYTRKVFQWAHEEDPDAILILNDNYYNIEKKRLDIYNYVKKLVDDGIPIHGIGFQHHHFFDISEQDIEKTLKLFSSIPNLKLFITELDLRSANLEDYSIRYPEFMKDEILALNAKKYASLFDVYRKYADRIETVGFWNVCDKTSWLNNGSKNYYGVLPFGFNGEPNPAFYSILDIEGKLPRLGEGDILPVVRKNNYIIDNALDKLKISGNFEGDVKAELYELSCNKKLLDAQKITSKGDYTLSFDLNGEFNGDTSPDYELTVYEGETAKTDTFTYYSKSDDFYTITDSICDTSKIYSLKNLVFSKNPDNYNGDESGLTPQWFWGGDGANIGDAEVIYKLPQNYAPDVFELDMFTPAKTDKTFDLYGSADGINYKKLDTEWVKTGKNKADYFAYTGTAKNIEADIKYLKIFMGNGKGRYLANVKITTTSMHDENLPAVLAAYNGTELDSLTIGTLSNLKIKAGEIVGAKLFTVALTDSGYEFKQISQ